MLGAKRTSIAQEFPLARVVQIIAAPLGDFEMTAQNTITTAIALAIAMMSSACTDEERERTKVGSTYHQLAAELHSCASSALACHEAAACEEAAERACRDELRACRETTRDAYRAFHVAVQGCLNDKHACVHDAWDDGGLTGDAGAEQLAACREQLSSCVEADRSIAAEPEPCMQALRECVRSRVLGEEGDRAAVGDCLNGAYMCIANHLPMCTDDPGLDGGS